MTAGAAGGMLDPEVGTVVNARPGYWDIDRCSWVGVEPMYVVPPTRTGGAMDLAHGRDPDSSAAAPGLPALRQEPAVPADPVAEGSGSAGPAS